MLNLVMIGVPLAGALVVLLLRRESEGADARLPVLASLIALVAGLVMFNGIRAGQPSEVVVAWIGPPHGLGLRADTLGLVLACLSTLIWLAASLSALDYLKGEGRQSLYHVFFLVTLSGVLGTFLAWDFLTLLLFFEIMTLASYFLVIHKRDREAVGAGSVYLYLSLGGSMLVVLGAGILYQATGGVALNVPVEPGGPVNLALALMITGFSVKAGMIPLHVWLPEAHPVAPAPASAVLSGIMIKTGAYGILRVLLLVDGSTFARHLGLGLIAMATLTMLGGVSMALMQSNAKRMLAYHSVSQMGYVLMGVGLVGYLGLADPVALAGGLYHVVNHALFKSALFLVAGAVYMKTNQLNMYRLGGLWRYMPATALLGLIAAMGIGGIPGLNGYASKTVLHHGLVHAMYQEPALVWVEWAFTLTGAGTACSFIKFFSYIFLGRVKGSEPTRQGEPLWTVLGTAIPTVFIVYLGLNPTAFLNLVASSSLMHLEAPFTVVSVTIFAPKDLQAIAISLILGATLFFLGSRWGLFHLHPAKWFSVQWLARTWAAAISRWWSRFLDHLEAASAHGAGGFGGLMEMGYSWLRQLDSQGSSPYRRFQPNIANLSFDAALVVAVLTLVLIARAALAFW